MLYQNGLAKLTEELGELAQIVGKKSAYFDTDIHPDGKGSMKIRMEEEMADVMAAISIVAERMNLDMDHINQRTDRKFKLFTEWANDPDEVV